MNEMDEKQQSATHQMRYRYAQEAQDRINTVTSLVTIDLDPGSYKHVMCALAEANGLLGALMADFIELPAHIDTDK